MSWPASAAKPTTRYNTTMSDTPRTDKQPLKRTLDKLCSHGPDLVHFWRPDEFTRQLERELNRSNAEREQLKAQCESLIEGGEDLRDENIRLMREMDRLETKWERDSARLDWLLGGNRIGGSVNMRGISDRGALDLMMLEDRQEREDLKAEKLQADAREDSE